MSHITLKRSFKLKFGEMALFLVTICLTRWNNKEEPWRKKKKISLIWQGLPRKGPVRGGPRKGRHKTDGRVHQRPCCRTCLHFQYTKVSVLTEVTARKAYLSLQMRYFGSESKPGRCLVKKQLMEQ